jgi:hypothetical protein
VRSLSQAEPDAGVGAAGQNRVVGVWSSQQCHMMMRSPGAGQIRVACWWVLAAARWRWQIARAKG